MYLSTRTPPVDIQKWRLLYKQIMSDNIVKHSYNKVKRVSIGDVIAVSEYCGLKKHL